MVIMVYLVKKLALAFILVNVETGMENEVLQEVSKVPGVREAYLVYGVYDLLVKIEADSAGALREAVINHIRRLSGVRSTLTMMVVGTG
jgi:DNA-binding Lrp family transcriptional regulator